MTNVAAYKSSIGPCQSSAYILRVPILVFQSQADKGVCTAPAKLEVPLRTELDFSDEH